MPDIFYTHDQIDSLFGIAGNRITSETDPAKVKAELDALTDTNFMTDAERTKLAGLEGSKFLGTFISSAAIPTVGAVAGSYADVDAGVGTDVERWIYDVDDGVFVKAVGTIAGETDASIKTKYENNADTNAYTDAEKAKLAALTVAPDTVSAIAALDGAIT